MMNAKKRAERKKGLVFPAPSSKQSSGKWRVLWQLMSAAGIVSLTGFLLLPYNVRPVSSLLALAIAVIVAALISGRKGAWVAITFAAVLGALRMPPSDTLYIDPSYRLGYALFLVLCLLITLYHPPRSSVPHERKALKKRQYYQPYTEANLPTLAPTTRGDVETITCEVAGMDIYKWERACAHLRDVIADAQIKMRENDPEQAYFLLQHAHQLADETRRHIQQTDLFAPPSADNDASATES